MLHQEQGVFIQGGEEESAQETQKNSRQDSYHLMRLEKVELLLVMQGCHSLTINNDYL